MADDKKIETFSSSSVLDINVFHQRKLLCRFLPAIIELEAACRSYGMTDVAIPLSDALDRMESYMSES